MQGFKWFLINEQNAHLGHRIGDVLTAVHELERDLPGMGSRQVSKVVEEIANQIRKILHSQWASRYTYQLKDLQKIGVALMKAIDEKGDMNALIPSIARQLEKMSGELGVKTNNLQAPPENSELNDPQVDMELTGAEPDMSQPGQNSAPDMLS